MITSWTSLTCLVALGSVVPIHLCLWLPLTDRRLHRHSGSGRMSLPALWLVFGATVLLHLVWTLLTSSTLSPPAAQLVGLVIANVLLAPCFFSAAYGVWLHSCILRQPQNDSRPGEESEPLDEALPSVTVVIACRNEPFEVVLMTTQSALNLRYPRCRLEIMLADNSDEDHPDYLALCREVEARQRAGEPITLLHRRGTRGLKAGNLDMALQAVRSDLLLFLDVDNSVPENLLLLHAKRLWCDPESAFSQCLHLVCNGHVSLLAAAASSVIGYAKYHDLALSTFSDWSFFQGHACLWKRHVLLDAAPISQYFRGESILTEDLYISFRASRLGALGCAYPTPTGYWAPAELAGYEAMLVRWSRGTWQSYVKDARFILSRAMGYDNPGSYAALWYRILQSWALWLIPLLLVLLPFTSSGAWLLAAVWLITGLLPSLLIMGLRRDANVAGVLCGPMDLLRHHLLFLFQIWTHFSACLRFAVGGASGWSQTPKVFPEESDQKSWLDAFVQFRSALLFSLLIAGLPLAWKGVVVREPLLSPATFPVLYLAVGIVIAIVVFAFPRQAPASSRLRRHRLPSWMGSVADPASSQ